MTTHKWESLVCKLSIRQVSGGEGGVEVERGLKLHQSNSADHSAMHTMHTKYRSHIKRSRIQYFQGHTLHETKKRTVRVECNVYKMSK